MIRRRKHSDDIEDPLVPSGMKNSWFTTRRSSILSKLAVLSLIVLVLVVFTRRGVDDVADADVQGTHSPHPRHLSSLSVACSFGCSKGVLELLFDGRRERASSLRPRELPSLPGSARPRSWWRGNGALHCSASFRVTTLSGSVNASHRRRQLCNRIRLIVSALILGLLTDRVVLVEFRTGYYASMVWT